MVFTPVLSANWDRPDSFTIDGYGGYQALDKALALDPDALIQLVDDLRSGAEVRSTRGPRVVTWREAERVLAGFPDDLADEGPSAGPASLVGLELAREQGWSAPSAAGDHQADHAVPEQQQHVGQAAADAGSRQSESAVVEKESGTGEAAAEKGEGK